MQLKLTSIWCFVVGRGNRTLGTGFVINKKLRVILDFMPILERICMMRIRDRYQKIMIVNIQKKSIEIREEFYNQEARVCERIPKYDIKIVLSDAYAKISREEL